MTKTEELAKKFQERSAATTITEAAAEAAGNLAEAALPDPDKPEPGRAPEGYLKEVGARFVVEVGQADDDIWPEAAVRLEKGDGELIIGRTIDGVAQLGKASEVLGEHAGQLPIGRIVAGVASRALGFRPDPKKG